MIWNLRGDEQKKKKKKRKLGGKLIMSCPTGRLIQAIHEEFPRELLPAGLREHAVSISRLLELDERQATFLLPGEATFVVAQKKRLG